MGGGQMRRRRQGRPESLEPRWVFSAASGAMDLFGLADSASHISSTSAAAVHGRVSDGYFSTAQDLGVVTSATARSDSIGGRDTTDFYKFSLSATAPIRIQLIGLAADVSLRLYDAKRQFLFGMSSQGHSSESILGTATAGTYYVRVSPATFWDATTYQLTVHVSPGSPTTSPPTTPTTPSTPATPTS